MTPASAMLTVAAATVSRTTPVTDPESARRIVEEVLSHPEYESGLRSFDANPRLVQIVLDAASRFWSWLEQLSSGLADLRVTQPLLFWLILCALLLALTLLLWHIAFSISVAFRRPAETLATEVAEEATPAYFREHQLAAETLAARGDFGEAIRRLLLALLARVEARRVPIFSGWTNREIVEHLRLDEERRRSLARFVDTVDRLWYGQQPATEEDFRASAAIVASYLDEHPKGEAPAARRETGRARRE